MRGRAEGHSFPLVTHCSSTHNLRDLLALLELLWRPGLLDRLERRLHVLRADELNARLGHIVVGGHETHGSAISVPRAGQRERRTLILFEWKKSPPMCTAA